jgi:acetyl-CoA C-acetyltransferase
MQDIFVVSAVRTAIGTFGGALKDKKPSELGAIVARAAMDRAGVTPEKIGHVVFGR